MFSLNVFSAAYENTMAVFEDLCLYPDAGTLFQTLKEHLSSTWSDSEDG
jgi:hypothetical protein